MDSLVSTDWLAAHLVEPDIVVLDATRHLPGVERDPQEDFHAAHIPGARFLDLASLTDRDSPVPGALPRVRVAGAPFALAVCLTQHAREHQSFEK